MAEWSWFYNEDPIVPCLLLPSSSVLRDWTLELIWTQEFLSVGWVKFHLIATADGNVVLATEIWFLWYKDAVLALAYTLRAIDQPKKNGEQEDAVKFHLFVHENNSQASDCLEG